MVYYVQKLIANVIGLSFGAGQVVYGGFVLISTSNEGSKNQNKDLKNTEMLWGEVQLWHCELITTSNLLFIID